MSTASPSTHPCFTQAFPGFGEVWLHPLSLDADMPLLHGWFNQPYARFWGLQGKTLDEVHEAYAQRLRTPGHEVLMARRPGQGAVPGEPLGLCEVYLPDTDVLASVCRIQPGDRGIHLLMAPQRPGHVSVPALAFYVLRTLSAYVLGDPGAQRLLAEPDLRNDKAIARFVQAGFALSEVVYLPHKTAQMVVLERLRQARLPSEPPAKVLLPDWPRKAKWHALWRPVAKRLRRGPIDLDTV